MSSYRVTSLAKKCILIGRYLNKDKLTMTQYMATLHIINVI